MKIWQDSFLTARWQTAQAVIKFAESQGIAPGIVVGRLQNDGYIKHSVLNELKEKLVLAQNENNTGII